MYMYRCSFQSPKLRSSFTASVYGDKNDYFRAIKQQFARVRKTQELAHGPQPRSSCHDLPNNGRGLNLDSSPNLCNGGSTASTYIIHPFQLAVFFMAWENASCFVNINLSIKPNKPYSCSTILSSREYLDSQNGAHLLKDELE